jgi:hypothetical protein
VLAAPRLGRKFIPGGMMLPPQIADKRRSIKIVLTHAWHFSRALQRGISWSTKAKCQSIKRSTQLSLINSDKSPA